MRKGALLLLPLRALARELLPRGAELGGGAALDGKHISRVALSVRTASGFPELEHILEQSQAAPPKQQDMDPQTHGRAPHFHGSATQRKQIQRQSERPPVHV